jgi:hypothetical protein
MMLHVQHFVLQDIQRTSSDEITWIKWDTMQTGVDEGWMYLALDQDNKVDLIDINGTYPQSQFRLAIW